MAWIDAYRQGSYKNIEFHVPSHDFRGGKRGKLWQFPFKQLPYMQRMGRKAHKFNVECYVIGEDSWDQRDALIEALDKDESGKLVHPYLGELTVEVLDYSFRETWRETRMARFTLNCVEAGENTTPSVKVDSLTATSIQKVSAYDSLIAAFDRAYNVLTVPTSIVDNVLANIDKGLNVLDKAKTAVSAIADYKKAIDTAKAKIIGLAYDGLELAQNITELSQFGTNVENTSTPVTVENAAENFENMQTLMEFTPDKIISEDPLSPDNLFNDMFVLSGTISACTLLTVLNFDNYSQMIDFRNIAFASLETFLKKTEDDDLYNELYALRARVSRDLDERSAQLPRLSKVVLPEHIPAIVMSHNLYQNVENEQDLIDRNGILNPMFMPAQIELEVLTYA